MVRLRHGRIAIVKCRLRGGIVRQLCEVLHYVQANTDSASGSRFGDRCRTYRAFLKARTAFRKDWLCSLPQNLKCRTRGFAMLDRLGLYRLRQPGRSSLKNRDCASNDGLIALLFGELVPESRRSLSDLSQAGESYLALFFDNSVGQFDICG